MSTHYDQTFSSIEAIESTIQYDRQVCRWFQFLIQKVLVLDKSSSHRLNQKKKLSIIIFIQNLLYGILFPMSIFVWFNFNVNLLGFLLILIIAAFMVYRLRSRMISTLALELIRQDFLPKDLPCKTLYQIGEYYSRVYHIPSLVDVITAYDRYSRWILFLIPVNLIFIYPLSLINIFFLTAVFYVGIHGILNSSIVYSKLI